MMTRRNLLSKLAIGGLASWFGPARVGQAANLNAVNPMKLTDEQWRSRLTPLQYRVLRHEGTEPPGSSPLNNEKRAGVYKCVACDLPLFSSRMKYDSGTGWPSFFDALPGALGFRDDYKLFMVRTEYHCSRCGGHHGHVFGDGPRPTGKRYCNNGVCLKFEPEVA